MLIKCSCGHEADFIQFTRTPLNGDLPPGEFQCPSYCAQFVFRMEDRVQRGEWGLMCKHIIAVRKFDLFRRKGLR